MGRTVLLLKTGTAAEPLRRGPGDYDRWFAEALAPLAPKVTRVQVHLGEALPPDPHAFDAILITGSPLSVTQPAPWMDALADTVLDAAERGTPVLGVCFGHQLLARAYGAKVVRSDQGREVGSVQVTLTPEGRADPLFAGIPERFTVQATHEDVVVDVPQGALVPLAGNGHTTLQAFARGKHVRGVQFHPELSPSGMRTLVESRADAIDREAVARGAEPGMRVRELLAGISPTPFGPRILANFLEAFT